MQRFFWSHLRLSFISLHLDFRSKAQDSSGSLISSLNYSFTKISTYVFYFFHLILFFQFVRWRPSRTSQEISCNVSFDSAGPALSAASLQKITFWLRGECFFCWSCSAYVADRSLASNSFFCIIPIPVSLKYPLCCSPLDSQAFDASTASSWPSCSSCATTPTLCLTSSSGETGTVRRPPGFCCSCGAMRRRSWASAGTSKEWLQVSLRVHSLFWPSKLMFDGDERTTKPETDGFYFPPEDPQKPILCPHQEEDMDLSPPINVPSAAVLEISENLRAKIYSIFCKLGNNTQYKFFGCWLNSGALKMHKDKFLNRLSVPKETQAASKNCL